MSDAARVVRIHNAFREGNLDMLRAAVDDAAAVPNGIMPMGIGSCLVYAVYHSPLEFIRTLLELGADPNAPADDGFPPLIAALTCTRDVAGGPRRTDVDAVLRLLLAYGADVNQRGINDYTALHMAVANGTRWRSKYCSTPAPIRTCGRASTIARRHSRWRAPLVSTP